MSPLFPGCWHHKFCLSYQRQMFHITKEHCHLRKKSQIRIYILKHIYIHTLLVPNSFFTERVKSWLVHRAGATSASLNPIKEPKITWCFTENVHYFSRQRRTAPRSCYSAFAQELTCHKISLDCSSGTSSGRQSFSNPFLLPEPQHTYPSYFKKQKGFQSQMFCNEKWAAGNADTWLVA